MGERYKDYTDLAKQLKEYSYQRKGEIARLTYQAAVTIDVLVGRLKMLEDKMEDDLK